MPAHENVEYAPKKNQSVLHRAMLLLRKEKLPEGDDWLYEIKLDGYRAVGIKSGGRIQLRSRNDNDFSLRYLKIVRGLASLPDETVTGGAVSPHSVEE